MSFSVKRDFISIFAIEALLVLCMTVFGFASATSWFFWVFFGITFILFAIYNYSVICASCEMDDNHLVFRTGFFKYDIDLNKVTSVYKSKNFYGSLALSIDRLTLHVNEDGKDKFYNISVQDNDKLLELINLRLEHNKNVKQNKPVEQKISQEKAEEKTTEQVEEKATKSPAKKTTTTKKKSTTTKKSTATKSKSTTAKKQSTTKKTTTKSSASKSSKTKSTK